MGKKHKGGRSDRYGTSHKLGVRMNPRSITVAALMGLTCIGAVPTAAALAQQATVSAGTFDAEVAAARAAMMGDPEAALRHASTATALSAQTTDVQARPVQEATGSWLEAEALMRVNRPQQAGPAIERGMALVTEHAPGTKLHADLLRTRAALSLVTGQVPSALADLLAARDMYRTLGEARSQAIVLQNLGSLYSQGRHFERALRYYQESSEAFAGDPALTLSTHNNRGNALKEMGRFIDAEREFGLALQVAQQMGSELLQARILSNLASAQALRGDDSQAETNVQLGLALAHRSALGWEPYLWGVRAQIALARHDLPTARTYIERTFAGMDLDGSNMSYREFHDTARRIYSALGDATSAARHTIAFRRLDDQGRTIAASTSAALSTGPMMIADVERSPDALTAGTQIASSRMAY